MCATGCVLFACCTGAYVALKAKTTTEAELELLRCPKRHVKQADMHLQRLQACNVELVSKSLKAVFTPCARMLLIPERCT